MRYKGRKMLAVLVAVLAVGVVGAATASAALPEFSKKAAFTGLVGGSTFVAENCGCQYPEWKYTNGVINGTMPTTSTLGGVKLSFDGGTIVGSTRLSCYSKYEGDYTYDDLELRGPKEEGFKGRLGYINKEKKEVGLLLGGPEHLGSCQILNESNENLAGDMIAKITPVNTKTTHFTLTLKAKGHEQEFTKFEGEKEGFPLLTGSYECLTSEGKEYCFHTGEPAGVTAEIKMTTLEEIELKA
jgi:hypothetical protein